ncbi:unnamed protein product [Cyprideis torosa]|uniref:Uncharacterized protein n=1 Tax=Cyprideis torosa TaxID=163714 RepID=A0A7R8ZHR1_9CRUS|nr:unnamed protein product [Cyprideis torosa]CAG0884329.1 unnamed protein product [Cyprideis torosa]
MPFQSRPPPRRRFSVAIPFGRHIFGPSDKVQPVCHAGGGGTLLLVDEQNIWRVLGCLYCGQQRHQPSVRVSPYTMDSSTPTPPPAATPATQRSHSNNTHMRNSSGTGTASRSISMASVSSVRKPLDYISIASVSSVRKPLDYISIASVSSEGSVESTGGVGGGGGGHMEQEDIVQLTQEVRAFKEALGKMRRILPSEFRGPIMRDGGDKLNNLPREEERTEI